MNTERNRDKLFNILHIMDEIIKIDTIDQYNKLYGLETMHPLVGIVDLKSNQSSESYPDQYGLLFAILETYEVRRPQIR